MKRITAFLLLLCCLAAMTGCGKDTHTTTPTVTWNGKALYSSAMAELSNESGCYRFDYSATVTRGNASSVSTGLAMVDGSSFVFVTGAEGRYSQTTTIIGTTAYTHLIYGNTEQKTKKEDLTEQDISDSRRTYVDAYLALVLPLSDALLDSTPVTDRTMTMSPPMEAYLGFISMTPFGTEIDSITVRDSSYKVTFGVAGNLVRVENTFTLQSRTDPSNTITYSVTIVFSEGSIIYPPADADRYMAE